MRQVTDEFGAQFEVVWHPYFLDPALPKSGLTKRENYQRKGLNQAKLEKVEKKMASEFASVGLKYSLDGPIGNTMDSHRLAEWVFENYGAAMQDKFVDVLFRKFFSDDENPADHAVLLGAVEEAGIDHDKARIFLESGEGRENVIHKAEDMMSAATGVPHYLLTVEGTQTEEKPMGIRSQVPGAQETDTFYKVFCQAIKKAHEQLATAKL